MLKDKYSMLPGKTEFIAFSILQIFCNVCEEKNVLVVFAARRVFFSVFSGTTI